MERVKDLGIGKTINKTRLKAKQLETFPTVYEQSLVQNIVFVFEEGMRSMLIDALVIRDFSEDALILSKAAAIKEKTCSVTQGSNSKALLLKSAKKAHFQLV